MGLSFKKKKSQSQKIEINNSQKMEKVGLGFFPPEILIKIRSYSKSGFPSQITSYQINITKCSPLF